jgi:hypothetical protein
VHEGGWDPRYARVMDVATLGDHAAALIDSNGDGADINVDLYRRGSDGRWQPMASGNGSVAADGVLVTWDEQDRLE